MVTPAVTPEGSSFTSSPRPFITSSPKPTFTSTPFYPAKDPTKTVETTQTDKAAQQSPNDYLCFMIDGHQDIAWNALEFGRDPLQSAARVRQQETGTSLPLLIGERTTGLPDWIAGKIGIIFATLFVMPARYGYNGWNKVTYTTPQQAFDHAQAQIEHYQKLVDDEPQLRMIKSVTDLESVVSTWCGNNISQTGVVGLILLMEGADAIIFPEDLPNWFQAGLRIVGPAWKATRYSGGTGAPGPLTDLGRELLSEMADLNMILDLSHTSEEAFLEAVETYPGMLIASHSNPRAFIPTDRGLSDEMIQKLAARKGVMGISLHNGHLKPGWSLDHSREGITLDTVVKAIDYPVQLVGSVDHVAIGSDFDGGFGLDSIPAGFDTAADLMKIANALEEYGYKPAEIQAVMNGNWLRVLRENLPANQ